MYTMSYRQSFLVSAVLSGCLLTFPQISEAGLLKDLIKGTLTAIASGAASGAAEAAYKDFTSEDEDVPTSDSSTDDSSDDIHEKRTNIADAVRSVMEYYHHISERDIEGVQGKWVDPSSRKAINSVEIIQKGGGGECQADDGHVVSYSSESIMLYLEVVCDEGENRRNQQYDIKFDLRKTGGEWLIDDFNSA